MANQSQQKQHQRIRELEREVKGLQNDVALGNARYVKAQLDLADYRHRLMAIRDMTESALRISPADKATRASGAGRGKGKGV